MLIRQYSTLLTMLLSIFLSVQLAAMDIEVQGAYVRESIPGASNSVAYMQIHNRSNSELVLIEVVSDQIPKVNIHAHLHENGVMGMRPVKEVVIPAQGSFQFKPGGHHLMLMGLQQALEAGQMIDFQLKFKKASAFSVKAPVQSISAEFQ